MIHCRNLVWNFDGTSLLLNRLFCHI